MWMIAKRPSGTAEECVCHQPKGTEEMTFGFDPDPHGYSSTDLSQDRYGHCRQRADEACCGKETWVLEALGDKQKSEREGCVCNDETTGKGGWALVQREPTGVGRVHSQPRLANQRDDQFREQTEFARFRGTSESGTG